MARARDQALMPEEAQAPFKDPVDALRIVETPLIIKVRKPIDDHPKHVYILPKYFNPSYSSQRLTIPQGQFSELYVYRFRAVIFGERKSHRSVDL
jgi:hypothetical protein